MIDEKERKLMWYNWFTELKTIQKMFWESKSENKYSSLYRPTCICISTCMLKRTEGHCLSDQLIQIGLDNIHDFITAALDNQQIVGVPVLA